MTRLPLFLIAFLPLVGCLEYTPLYKVGTTELEANVTRAQCNTFAANTVPPLIVTDWIPVYNREGRIVGSRTEVYDANEGKRHTAVRTCMESQGFRRVSIPYCPKEYLETNNYRALTKAPQLTPSICAVRQSGGKKVLIDLNNPVN
ncbi:hypothetical protein [Shimia sp.]|uniref:hypothetical protein n=1 Tax=Shimia sp. TaxID=1954381 RepID=UPI003298C2B4